MLKLELGVVGSKKIVALEFSENDRDILKKISKDTPKFLGKSGYGLDLIEMLQGRLIMEYAEGQLTGLQETIDEFNKKYFSNIDYETAYNNLLKNHDKLTNEVLDLSQKYDEALRRYNNIVSSCNKVIETLKLLNNN